MSDWRLGFGHDVQIHRWIGFHAFDQDQGIAEQLPPPSANLLGGGEGLALLDPCQNPEKLRPTNVVDRHFPQGGQHILAEDALDLRQRAVAAGLEFLRAIFNPGVVDGLEGEIRCQLDGMALLLAIEMKIDALGQAPGLRRARHGPRAG